MVDYYSITAFRERLQALLKVKRGVYAGVWDEICNAFKDVSMETILNNRDMILLDDPLIVIKLRLPDKKHRLAKKDGFRLIYMAYRNKAKVVFLDIYPKNGPSQQLDITDSELLDLIEQYTQESLANHLVSHDISRGML